MAAREVKFDDVKALVGKQLGVSDWHTVTQQDINAFADATRDHQWIHIDVQRAKKESPYKTTIAHGYFTLSLVPHFMSQIWKITGSRMGVNYGLNKVRFPAPVPVGAKIRARAELQEASDVDGGLQLVTKVTIEVQGAPKPACVAETVSRVYN